MRISAVLSLALCQASLLAIFGAGCAEMSAVRAERLAKIKRVHVVADLQRTEIPVQHRSMFSSSNESEHRGGNSGAVANLMVAQTRRDLALSAEDNHALVLQTVNDSLAGFDKLESFVTSLRSGGDPAQVSVVADVTGQWKLSKAESQRIVSSASESAVMFLHVDQIMSQDARVFEVTAVSQVFASGARTSESPEIECRFVYQSELQPGMDRWAVSRGALTRREWASAATEFAGMAGHCINDARGLSATRQLLSVSGFSSSESTLVVSGELVSDSGGRYVVRDSGNTYYSLPKSNPPPNDTRPPIVRVGR